jgi:peroxiredoxin/uncharacterized membrane protein YphA (DoxX/SURF4 family)
MEIVLLLARLFLALILGLAGATKAADLPGTRKAMIGFGVPKNLAVLVGSGLPFAEMLVAVALLPRDTAWLGAIAALWLLSLFSAAIVMNLVQGQKPDCHCFGQLHSRPVSWSVFCRNLIFMGLASLVVVRGSEDPGLSAFNWLGDLKTGELASLVLSIVAVSLVAVAVVYLRRIIVQQTTLLATVEAMKKVLDEDYAEPPVEREDAARPLEGLQVGAPAPGFSLASMVGKQVTLEDLLTYRKPILLLFVSPNCSPCKTILPAVKTWERDYGDRLTIAVLSKRTTDANQNWVAKYGATNVLIQGEYAVSEQYQAKWTPAAVLVNRRGRIASQMTYGDEAIRALVNHTITGGAMGDGSIGSPPHVTFTGGRPLEIGQRATNFSLPDLQGRTVRTQDILGEDTLLLFWDPGCPHCQAMSGELRAWEQNPPKRAPRLIIIASGNAENVRTNGGQFESLILLDPDFNTGQLFGSYSTPSAVLIDADGRIASRLAIGDRNVLELAGALQVELSVAAAGS